MKDRIKELMEAQHMNQQTFSHYTGINTATLSSIFTGRTRPTLNIIESIMRKFPEVNINWLMFGQGAMMNAPTDGQNLASSPHNEKQDIFDVQAKTPIASPQILNFGDAVNEETNNPHQPANNPPSRNYENRRDDSFQDHAQGYHHPSTTQSYPAQNNNVSEPITPSANLAVKTNPQENTRQQGYTNRQQVIPQQTENPAEDIYTNLNIPSQPKRKVTEIRVFYDDQTWEAFVPKNKGGF